MSVPTDPGPAAPPADDSLVWRFEGTLFAWRGPSPYHFVAVPEAHCPAIQQAAAWFSYGWGVVPVRALLGKTEFTTSLIPKDGRFLLPVKDAVRSAEGLAVGDSVTVRVAIRPQR